jgi:hypothetical protein
MAAGDAQRVWFPEMVQTLRSEWHHGISFEATIELRDGLDGCSNEFDPSGTSVHRSLNVRLVGMLVKAASPMSAFVQCSCRAYDSASPTPSMSRRLKRVGRCTGSRTDSTFLAKVRGFHLPRCLTAVIHKCDKPTIRPRDRVCRVWYWKSKSMVRAGRRESAHI